MIVPFNTRLSLTIEFLAGCTLSLLLETRKYMDWYLYFAPNMFDNQEASFQRGKMPSAKLLAALPRVCRKLSGKQGCQVLTYVDDASFVRFS